MDTSRFHSQEGWLEQGLGTTESLVANGDHLTIRKFVALLHAGTASSCLHLLFKVQSHIAQLLLDVTDDFTFCCGGERVTSLGQDLHQVVGQITSCQIQTEDSMRKGITFVDGNGVGHSISRVKHDTGGTTGCIQGQYSLDGYVHCWSVEGLKHDLGHLFSVGLGVEWSLCQQHWVLFWCNTEFIVEGVMPDLTAKGKHNKRDYTTCSFLTFSISSQLVTIPCSMGYFNVRIPRLLWASSPT